MASIYHSTLSNAEKKCDITMDDFVSDASNHTMYGIAAKYMCDQSWHSVVGDSRFILCIVTGKFITDEGNAEILCYVEMWDGLKFWSPTVLVISSSVI